MLYTVNLIVSVQMHCIIGSQFIQQICFVVNAMNLFLCAHGNLGTQFKLEIWFLKYTVNLVLGMHHKFDSLCT